MFVSELVGYPKDRFRAHMSYLSCVFLTSDSSVSVSSGSLTLGVLQTEYKNLTSWDEVIKNDRKKLDMDSADPQNRSEWRGCLYERLVKKTNPW